MVSGSRTGAAGHSTRNSGLGFSALDSTWTELLAFMHTELGKQRWRSKFLHSLQRDSKWPEYTPCTHKN
eukprot:1148498-Pelagomonas_calceolata.AAC.1